MTKEKLLTKRISAISLGCDKNRVDLEHMLFLLHEYGFEIIDDINIAEIIIVNTCAFIQPSIIEAVNNIEIALSLKQNGLAEKVIVAGCLPMRDKEIVKNNFPEVDAFLTLKDNNNITNIIEDLYKVKNTNFYTKATGRIITNEGSYAYLKIAEGCSNGCAYCTIPRIRGRFTSIPCEQLINETKFLVSRGYKEIILVAQDTAKYGDDLYGKPKLIELLKSLIKIKGLRWIRLQYIYPEWVTKELLDFIVNNEKICNYIDMPLQHIDDAILKNMNRKMGENKSRYLINLIKDKYPEITIRSTFIVGLPGETRKAFKKLCNFIKEGKITYATFFPYYREEKTKAYFMKNQVWSFIKKLRLKKIQNIQNIVLNNINVQMIGAEQEVLIDKYDPEQKIFYAHSQNNSPNIDLCVIINKDVNQIDKIKIGEFYKVKLVSMCDLGFKGEIYDT